MKGLLQVSLLLTAFAITGCGEKEPAKPPVPQADPAARRATTAGAVVGFRDAENTFAWLGIPYAQAPIGALRWRAPRPATVWEGVKETLQFKSFCPQLASIGLDVPKEQYGQLMGSEDCLFLNVWAPQAIADTKQKLPVMVWIHGGGNVGGTANTYSFANVLAGRQEVVVVTLNYRLGIFGWFRDPALAAANTEIDPALLAADRSGNFGTLDIVQSLHWVHDNIAAFGGDPDNVTIFGESAGGFNVYSIMLSPLAKGLFHKAISQSGGIRSESVAAAENFVDEMPAGHLASAKELSVKLLQADGHATTREAAKDWLAKHSAPEVAAWLYTQTPAQLFAQLGVRAERLGLVDLPLVFRDGYVLPRQSPADLMADPTPFTRVPLITGTNRDEMKTFMSGDPHFVSKWFGVIPHIRDQEEYERAAFYGSNFWRLIGADLPASVFTADIAQPPVFAYRFDFDQLKNNWLVSLPSLLGAGHGFEITYAFGLEGEMSKFDVNSVDTLPARQHIAVAMSSYWANFAYTGTPGRGRSGDLPLWEPWSNSTDAPKALLIDADNRGGIRQSHDALTLASVKQQMRSDPALQHATETRCRTWASVFYYGIFGAAFFDAAEYAALGCEAFPVTGFAKH